MGEYLVSMENFLKRLESFSVTTISSATGLSHLKMFCKSRRFPEANKYFSLIRTVSRRNKHINRSDPYQGASKSLLLVCSVFFYTEFE